MMSMSMMTSNSKVCAGIRGTSRHSADRRACLAVQCDISTGTVIESSRLRVTPPSTISRTRLCP